MYQPKLPKDLRCPLEHALEFINGRWKSRILCLLYSSQSQRYGELKKLLDNITDTVLTATLKELIADSKKSRYPTLLLLDGIEDPHNLGAILRSADAFGIDGVVMRRHGQVPINPTVYRTSAGAACYVKAAEVSSLSNAIRELKDAGFWIVATDGEAKQEYYDVDYRLPVAIVVGSEGKGVSRLVLENSDFVVKIPMHGHVNSLNASVAAGIFLAQVDALRYKE